MSGLALHLPDDAVEQIAQRVAAILAERQAPEHDDGYLDVAGAAQFLSCPTSRIYALVSAKRIPHYKDGSRTLFDREQLREYVRNGGARRP
jgi:excisionase family DNA binding protein